MRRFLSFTLILFLFALHWKPISPIVLEESSTLFTWESVGPTNLGGSITALIEYKGKLYAGTGFGGLYESADQGKTWRIVPGYSLNKNGEERYVNPSISHLAVQGDVMYVASGSVAQYDLVGISLSSLTIAGGITGNFGRPGTGIYTSTDGRNFSNQNATWRLTYPNISYSLNYANVGILNIVDIATSGDKVAIATSDTIFISGDRLATLQSTGFISSKPIRSLAWGAGGKLFVGGRESLYVSTDGGATFSTIRNIPLDPISMSPAPTITRVIVQVSPANPSVVYVALIGTSAVPSVSNGLLGVWVSSDEGANWTRIAPTESANQATNAFSVVGGGGTLIMRLHPTDPNRLVIGGRTLWEYMPNTGWLRVNPTPRVSGEALVVRIPPTIRSILYLSSGELLVAGEGRLVRISPDRTQLQPSDIGIWASRVMSLSIASDGTIYASGPSPLSIINRTEKDIPGTFRAATYSSDFSVSGISSSFLYGFTAASLIDPQISFLGFHGGRVRSATDQGQTYTSFYAAPLRTNCDPTNIQSLRASNDQDRPDNFGPHYTPIVLVEKFGERVLNRDGLREGKSFLFVATSGTVWCVSNPISTSPDTIARWNKVIQGNLGFIGEVALTDYYNPARIIPTAIAADSNTTLWIGTSNGQLYRVRNAGDLVPNTPGCMSPRAENLTDRIEGLVRGRWISAIAVHPRNPNLVAIAVGSYGGSRKRILLSTNATDAQPDFISIHANLPNIPVYSLFFYPDSSVFLLAGTEWGLWRCPDVTNPVWEEMTGESVGRVPVTAIAWKPFFYRVDTVVRGRPGQEPQIEGRLLPDPQKPIFIATWGRGIWKISGRKATALSHTELANQMRVEAYPNPFSTDLHLKLQLPEGAQRIQLSVFTLDGRKVAGQTYPNTLPVGEHTLRWNLSDIASGLYLLQVEVRDFSGQIHRQSLKILHE
ncbi:MAG: T9SS type A sorting domain-containing protein [Bacteroidia bacterium]|nr:T9SS type A sorting domain-containing protein [Bacteroidia bacterium]MDW8235947.1 T9SS type A sorting domain-containing protein [Bacteroidia bacterium]